MRHRPRRPPPRTPRSGRCHLPLVPPPEATQKVSEMQETEVKPPPGGRVVSAMLHPGVEGGGDRHGGGDGGGDPGGGRRRSYAVVVVGRGGGSVTLWATAGAAEAVRSSRSRPVSPGRHRVATVNRLGATCPLRPGSSCPIGLTDVQEYRPEPGEPGTMARTRPVGPRPHHGRNRPRCLSCLGPPASGRPFPCVVWGGSRCSSVASVFPRGPTRRSDRRKPGAGGRPPGPGRRPPRRPRQPTN